MKTLKKVFFPLAFCLLIFNCSKKDDTNEDKIILSEDEVLISGKVELSNEISTSDVKIVTPSGTFDLKEDSTFEALTNKIEKQAVFLESKNGDILLASLLESSVLELTPKSTARTMIGLMPWTAFVKKAKLNSLIDEIELKDEFKELVISVQNALGNNTSPLNDIQVLEKLNVISQSILSLSSKSSNLMKGQGILDIPEVDYTVEPVLTYSSGLLKVENDGTTTAAWGIEVYNEEVSVTGELILPGNKVQFPSLSSVWEFVKGSHSDLYFETSEPLEISLPTEDKFDIRFGSPTSANIVNSSLSRTAAAYNIAASYWVILKGLGIDGKLSASDIFDEGCANDFFDSTTNILVNVLTKGELTTKFFLEQVSELFNGTTKTFAACLVELDGLGFPDSGLKAEKYIKKLAKFLNAYEKVEASFITGKLFGDMLVLNDIRICRQFINGDMFPCFRLLKNPEIDGTELGSGNTIKLNVKTQLDEPNADNTVFPVGAYVHWDVIEGDGTLSAVGSTIGSDGIGEITYTMGQSDGSHKIRASVQGASGNIIDSVEYNLGIDFLIGTWEAISHNGIEMGVAENRTFSQAGFSSSSCGNLIYEELRDDIYRLTVTDDTYSYYFSSVSTKYNYETDDNITGACKLKLIGFDSPKTESGTDELLFESAGKLYKVSGTEKFYFFYNFIDDGKLEVISDGTTFVMVRQ